MDINSFQGLAPDAAIKQAATLAGVPESVISGIWSAESGRGVNMLSKAGARGHVGLMPATQAELERRAGRPINPDDLGDSMWAAGTLLRENIAKFGNIPDALRAYNAGWDTAKWDNPETNAYVPKVLGSDPVLREAYERGARAPIMRIPMLSLAGDTQGASLAELADEAYAREARHQAVTFTDQARAAFMQQGLLSVAALAYARPQFEPTPGFTPDPKRLVGLSSDELVRAYATRSDAELSYELGLIDVDRRDGATLAERGMPWALAAGLVAGLPEGIITGKAFSAPAVAAYRTASLARMANVSTRAGALGTSIAANIGGNVLATAAEDALTERVHMMDYAMAVPMGMIGVAAELRGIMAADHAARIHGAAIAEMDNLVLKKAEIEAEAVAQFAGREYTPDELNAEVSKITTQRLKTALEPVRRAFGANLDDLLAEEHAREQARTPANQQQAEPAVPVVHEQLSPEQAVELRDFVAVRELKTADKFYAALASEERGAEAFAMLPKQLREYTTRDAIIKNVESGNGAVHVIGSGVSPEAVELVKFLHKNYLPNHTLYLSDFGDEGMSGVRGQAQTFGPRLAMIRLRNGNPQTAVHEVGHIIINSFTAKMAGKGSKYAEAVHGIQEAHKEWYTNYVKGNDAVISTASKSGVGNYTQIAIRRMNIESHAMPDIMMSGFDAVSKDKTFAAYTAKFDEWGAESFARYIIEGINEVYPGFNLRPDRGVVAAVREWFSNAAALVKQMLAVTGKPNMTLPEIDARVKEFFVMARKFAKAEATKLERHTFGLDEMRGVGPLIDHQQADNVAVFSAAEQDFARTWGLDLLPTRTPQQRAEARWMLSVFKEATNPPAPWNNVDKRRVSMLANSATFGSNGLRMVTSEHPVMRMVASKLLEVTTGAGGRDQTASLRHWQYERKILGNVASEYQLAYAKYRSLVGGSIVEDGFGGKHWAEFNRKVSEAIENKSRNRANDTHPSVLEGVQAIEDAYSRSREVQVNSKVTGWAALPEHSVGYMPHLLDGQKLASAPLDEQRVVIGALAEQFERLGWDANFSADLATKYVDRVKRRALGSYDAPGLQHAVGSAEVVEEALHAMGMTAEEVRAHMERYMRPAPGHLKHRLDIDLMRAYRVGDKRIQLIDFFKTDQLAMLQQQTRRVAGEAALADFGVMGRAGLNLIRTALVTGPTPVDKAHLRDFDQVSAEFLGDKFGEHTGKFMDRAMQMNSLVRLGGMVWTQAAETITTATTLGIGHALRGVASLPRLIGEARALAAGKVVNNPILGSIEAAYGYTHGTDGYKLVFPFDSYGYEHGLAGVDKPEAIDRLLRGGTQLQQKLTGYRALHAGQVRMVSEQIVRKALKRIKQTGVGGSREGSSFESASLIDMGITPDVADRIRASLHESATFDGDTLMSFDITKVRDTDAADAFAQAVIRGSHQIIQGTFIGERGAWAHDGLLRFMTQFRTFSITAMEKQWTRNYATHGGAQMLGIMLGSMSAVLPVYIARMYANSIGRPDQQEYLEKRLSLDHMAVAVLNYVGWSGLAPDVINALSAVAGRTAKEETLLGKVANAANVTGARTGIEQGIVGSLVAPAAGLIESAYKQLQNTREGTNWHGVLDLMPMSKAPIVLQLMNTLRPTP